MWDGSGSWVGATAKDIARAVRRGDTSATQVVADHLDYIAAQESALGAFRVIRAAAAITEAEAVDEQDDLANLPLAGVPIAVKENTQVAGLPTWYGSAAARLAVAEEDHEVVRRLRGAGAIVVATSRMPELGLWGVTGAETALTRDPGGPDRTAGGSSGGAAAAVAAGLVPIAHGNDGLGSVRIPAACCGLVGVKPGRGVVPARMPVEDWFGLTEHGILATTVADATVGLSVLAGWAPVRLVQPDKLRIAVTTRSPVQGVRPDKPARDALHAATPPPAVDWHARPWRANLLANLRYAPYAAPWNIAGFPAVVVPMGVRPDGLPVAVQLVGPPGSELTLLGVAGQLEQASPWLRHAPGWPKVGATIKA